MIWQSLADVALVERDEQAVLTVLHELEAEIVGDESGEVQAQLGEQTELWDFLWSFLPNADLAPRKVTRPSENEDEENEENVVAEPEPEVPLPVVEPVSSVAVVEAVLSVWLVLCRRVLLQKSTANANNCRISERANTILAATQLAYTMRSGKVSRLSGSLLMVLASDSAERQALFGLTRGVAESLVTGLTLYGGVSKFSAPRSSEEQQEEATIVEAICRGLRNLSVDDDVATVLVASGIGPAFRALISAGGIVRQSAVAEAILYALINISCDGTLSVLLGSDGICDAIVELAGWYQCGVACAIQALAKKSHAEAQEALAAAQEAKEKASDEERNTVAEAIEEASNEVSTTAETLTKFDYMAATTTPSHYDADVLETLCWALRNLSGATQNVRLLRHTAIMTLLTDVLARKDRSKDLTEQAVWTLVSLTQSGEMAHTMLSDGVLPLFNTILDSAMAKVPEEFLEKELPSSIAAEVGPEVEATLHAITNLVMSASQVVPFNASDFPDMDDEEIKAARLRRCMDAEFSRAHSRSIREQVCSPELAASLVRLLRWFGGREAMLETICRTLYTLLEDCDVAANCFMGLSKRFQYLGEAFQKLNGVVESVFEVWKCAMALLEQGSEASKKEATDLFLQCELASSKTTVDVIRRHSQYAEMWKFGCYFLMRSGCYSEEERAELVEQGLLTEDNLVVLKGDQNLFATAWKFDRISPQ